MSGTTDPTTTTISPATQQAIRPMNVSAALGDGHSASDIANYLAANPQRAPIGATGKPYDVAAALQDGHSAASIIDHLNTNSGRWDADTSSQGSPILAPVARGIAQAQAGVANLLDDVGATGWGSGVRSRINQQDLQAPTTSGDLVSSIRSGSYGRALTDLPGAALEGALPLGAGIGAAAAAPVVAGSLPALASGASLATAGSTGIGAAGTTGAALGAGAVLGAGTQGDAIARARAANNGEAVPSNSDLAAGLLGGAATGVLGTIGDGLGGVAGRIGGMGAIGGLKGVIARFLGNNAPKVAADIAAPQAQSLASTAGTNVGASGADLSQSIAAAATGAATRTGMAGIGAAADAVPALTAEGRRAALQAQYAGMAPTDQEHAQDLAAAGSMLKAAQTGATGATLPVKQAAAAAAGQAVDRIGDLASSLLRQGVIDQRDRDTLNGAASAAADPKQVLTGDHLAAIADLGLDPDLTSAINGAMRSTDILSRVGADTAGPVQTTLQAVGLPLAGAAIGAIGGGHVGALAGSLIGPLVKPQIAAGLGRAGAVVDRTLGLGGSPVLKDAASSARLLDAAGVPVSDPSAAVGDAAGRSYDIAQAQLAAIQRASQQQAEAISINRQFDKNSAAGQADARAQYQAMLRDAYSTNQQADQIEAARQAMTTDLNRRATLQERAADQVSGMAYRSPDAVAARQAGIVGLPATMVDGSPSGLFTASGGMAGSPADVVPAMTGFRAPGGQPQPQSAPVPAEQAQGPVQPPVGVAQPAPQASAPGGIATPSAGSVATPGRVLAGQPQALSLLATARARAEAQGLLQASRQPQAARAAALSGTQQALQELAQYLPDWKYGIGSDVQNALVASGQPQPLNYNQVALTALRQMRDEGYINSNLHDAAAQHGGRLTSGFYNAVRNRALQNYGINRTAFGQ